MLETQDREIDGIAFRYKPLMATKARKLFDELVQRFGPSVGDAIGGIDKLGGEADEEGNVDMFGQLAKAIGSAVSGFSQNMDSQFHEQLVKQFGDQTLYENDQGNLVPLTKEVRETMFGTQLATELKWILFCLEVQFSDFLALFQKVLSRAGVEMTETGSNLTSPNLSTG